MWAVPMLGRSVRFVLALVAASGALVCALPAVARGSTVTVRDAAERVFGQEVVYTAAPGERNEVVLQEVELAAWSQSWQVHDSGAVIIAEGRCRALDAHTAQCDAGLLPPNPIAGYRALLGDQNDRLSVAATTSSGFVGWVMADGGPGDDVLFGGKRDYAVGDRLWGGGGRDELHGGGGPDYLSDGDLSDASGDKSPGRDVLDGGAGEDTVSYGPRTATVSVDLGDRSADGEPGEGDVLIGIDSIIGGHGADRLVGDDGPNSIDGRGGRDRLIGRGGSDRLSNGGSSSCGRGRDTVVTGSRYAGRPAQLAFVEPDCERVDPWHGVTLPAYPARTSRDSVSYILACPRGGEEGEEIQECSARLRLTEHAARHRVLAGGALPRGFWEARPLKLPLTPLGRLRASGPQGVRADATFTGYGFPAPARWTIRLRAPR